MARALLLLLLLLACARLGPRPARCQEAPQTPDWRMTLKTIRNGVHKIDVYLNAALDLLGGEDGLCQYKCSDGEEGGGGGSWRRGRDPAGPGRPLSPSVRPPPPARFRRRGPVGAAGAGGGRQRSPGNGAQPQGKPQDQVVTHVCVSLLRYVTCRSRPRLPQRGARRAVLQKGAGGGGWILLPSAL